MAKGWREFANKAPTRAPEIRITVADFSVEVLETGHQAIRATLSLESPRAEMSGRNLRTALDCA